MEQMLQGVEILTLCKKPTKLQDVHGSFVPLNAKKNIQKFPCWLDMLGALRHEIISDCTNFGFAVSCQWS